MRDPAIDRNFILQQGFQAPAPDACPLMTSALLFQPRVIGVWLIVAMAVREAVVFAALALVLWWSAALPRWNPFDAVFNGLVAPRGRLPRLTPAPAPRRAAQTIAGAMAAASAALLWTGATVAALVVAAVLLAAVAALAVGRFCVGSFLFHLARGRVDFALATLPWSRREPS